MAVVRDWRGIADLPALQSLAVAQRRVAPLRTNWHSGDLAWQIARESEWDIRIWEDGGEIVGWTWKKGDELEFEVRDDHRALVAEMLEDSGLRTVRVLVDDEEIVAAIAEQGFTGRGEWTMYFNRQAFDAPPQVLEVPDGFTLRSIEAADLVERVEIHRDVWAPSKLTAEKFTNVMATPPYRRSLDCVAVAPDGDFASYALLWPEDATGVGELEPVGTREQYRRLGLGAAVCTFALRQWYDQGGREAIVYCVTAPACALYESIGFRRYATLGTFTRPAVTAAT
ncbi:MAG TPA: GNAT family N-acetyltransferase [Gaiellaceae bacterium]|nr:GNAT family N-acetyltransferase [Gaiellaceae bacterium]